MYDNIRISVLDELSLLGSGLVASNFKKNYEKATMMIENLKQEGVLENKRMDDLLKDRENKLLMAENNLGFFNKITFGIFSKEDYAIYKKFKNEVKDISKKVPDTTLLVFNTNTKALNDFEDNVNLFIDVELSSDTDNIRLFTVLDELESKDSRLAKISRLKNDLEKIYVILKHVDNTLYELDDAQDAQNLDDYSDSNYSEYNSYVETEEANDAIRDLNKAVRDFGSYIQAEEADTYWGFDNGFTDYLERDSLDDSEDSVRRVREKFKSLENEIEKDYNLVKDAYDRDINKTKDLINDKRNTLKQKYLA